MLFILFALICQDFSGVNWQAPAAHFETADITAESRKQLKADLEETFAQVRNFRADTSIGKDGVIVTKELRISNVVKHDVIKSIDGRPVSSVADLANIMLTLEPGVFVQIELIRPTPKGNRANYAKTTVEYAPTSEYLLALAAFEAKDIKATRQVLYAPVDADKRRAIFLQLLVGPGDKVTEQVVFNYRRSHWGDQLDSVALITNSKTIRITGLYYNEDPQLEKKMRSVGEVTREWIEVDVSKIKDLLPVINGKEKMTLQLATETEISFDQDISDSLRENKYAIEKLKAALKSNRR